MHYMRAIQCRGTSERLSELTADKLSYLNAENLLFCQGNKAVKTCSVDSISNIEHTQESALGVISLLCVSMGARGDDRPLKIRGSLKI
jgi:hypothetical protein